MGGSGAEGWVDPCWSSGVDPRSPRLVARRLVAGSGEARIAGPCVLASGVGAGRERAVRGAVRISAPAPSAELGHESSSLALAGDEPGGGVVSQRPAEPVTIGSAGCRGTAEGS